LRIAIVGAGAIGTALGARLAQSGHPVSFIARGPELAALQATGPALALPDGSVAGPFPVKAFPDCESAGIHDLVILTVKAHQLGALAPDIPALVAPDTIIVPMLNGIPFWYFHRYHGPLAGTALTAVDPVGAIAATIPPDQVVGSVVYVAAERVRPGVSRLVEGDRIPVGELDGMPGERAHAVAECLTTAGFRAPVVDNIRDELWLKLWGNLTFNPLNALTRSPLKDICADPGARDLAIRMMTEAQKVGEAIGATFRVSLERRLEGAARSAHKTSMLQDLEAGRALEVEGLLGAVTEIARRAHVSTPTLDAIYVLTRRLSLAVAGPAARIPARESA
jgi:2-dehydropantoate 2-reductase